MLSCTCTVLVEFSRIELLTLEGFVDGIVLVVNLSSIIILDDSVQSRALLVTAIFCGTQRYGDDVA